MRSFLLCLILGANAAEATPWQPSAEEAAVIETLSVRHDVQPCSSLAANLSEPATSLAAIAEGVSAPPWVSIRAARCAVHQTNGVDHAVRWLNQPAFEGLARAALAELDALPPTPAATLAEAASAHIAVPWIRARLLQSSAPAPRSTP